MNFTLSNKYEFKYIRVNNKTPQKNVVARFDVSHLNKRAVNNTWDEIDEMFPKDNYVSCLESTHEKLRCFNNLETTSINS